MSQADVLEILEKVKKDKCPHCEGKGCGKCFNTGKRLLTSREIIKILSSKKVISIYAIDVSLRKLERQKEITKFVKFDGIAPRVYLWKILD